MTRDIKFRVWNGKRMCYDCGLSISKNEILFEKGDKIMTIPMQFTGLKDKTGKDIFEEDILKFIFKTKTKYPNGTIHYHEVVWNEVRAKWVLKRTDEKGKTHFVGLGKVHLKEHEIAGNSKENPELLGAKK